MAHSLLGDRYDDITEKLVYLKNSIVMNTDDEEDASDNEALRSAEREPKRRSSVELPVHSNSKPPIERQHRRSSSLMSVARLISGEETFSASSFLAALAGPTHQGPSSQHHPCPPLPEEDQLVEEDEEEFEDLFDFTKVLEMGKNVRTFTDDVMGSSIRLFKDFRDGVKEANEEPVEGWIVNDAYM
ncbi:hypothetical protein DFQ28_006031 [Apophysomyces sp. BC1034]|nr:hypothetical protein DFQ29_004948 [Apophysomyces sp. BC1021]KAG0187650.1 hypothetical protein DFQ28_006031 [Apophysomyces sp. BC1034]